MFNSFRRLLIKSKDREVPLASAAPPPFETSPNHAGKRKPSTLLRLPSRARPGLAADVARLKRCHRDLQRRFKQLPPGNPHIRKSKLRAAVVRIARNEYAPPPAQRRRIPEPSPTPSANRRLLASRSAPRGKANLISPPPPPTSTSSQNNRRYSTKMQIYVPSNSDEKPKPAAEASLGSWATPGEEEVIFKQAASAHRIRRLRAWSQTHQQQEGEGAEEEVVDCPAVAVAVAASKESPKAALKEQAAWSILADLQMETLDKQRQSSSKVGGSTSGKLGAAGGREMTAEATHRRRTEQQQQRSKHSDIPTRSPSDGEPKEKTQKSKLGKKRNTAVTKKAMGSS